MAKVYIFTRDKSLFASPNEQKALDEELSISALNIHDLRDIKVNDCQQLIRYCFRAKKTVRLCARQRR